MRFSPGAGSRDDYQIAFNVPTYRVAHPQIVFELRRARRYEHPLAVVLLTLRALPRPGVGAGGSAPPAAAVTPAMYGLLGAYLRNSLRETDILTGLPESLAFATVLPCVDRAGAEHAVERFREGFRECAGFDLRAGLASYPDDGLTIEDVLEQAWESWRQAVVPEITLTPEPRYSHG